MGEPVVSDRESVRTAWAMVQVLGLALALVGFSDFALLWYPPSWASIDWEFGTVSAAFDGLPLLTIGLGFATAAAVARGRRAAMGGLAAVLLMMLLLVVAMSLVFVLDVPVVIRAVDPQLRQTLYKSLVKTSSMALVYVALYLTLGVWVVRRIRQSTKGAGT